MNRLDGDDKEYGYIVDYKDLFKSLEGAVHDYTSGALDGYDKEDVAGLLADRLGKARERLEETRESVRALCEPVEAPKDSAAYQRYFCAKDSGNAEQLTANEPTRLALYKHVAAFVRAFADLANELAEAGYSAAEIDALKAEVSYYENVRSEVKLASLVQLIVERGAAALEALPDGIRKNKEAVAEAIENNVRKLIIDEQPINPKYYEKMSLLLDALIEQRHKEALDYQEYLRRIVELTKQVASPGASGTYPATMNTPAKRALFDNLDKNGTLALAVDTAVRASRQDDWRTNQFKVRRVRNAIRAALEGKPGVAHETPEPYGVHSSETLEEQVERILALVKNQDEY